jgi:hypothetical protein
MNNLKERKSRNTLLTVGVEMITIHCKEGIFNG